MRFWVSRRGFTAPALFLTAIFLIAASSAAPQRIVSLKPNVTEIIFDLGLEEHLVGVTAFCDYPAAARKKAKVGGYINPTLEAILALKPDLVVGETTGSALPVQRLQGMGIPTLILPFKTLADIESSIQTIGMKAGASERAAQLAAQFHRDLSARPLPVGQPKVRVLIIAGRDPLFGVGPGNFISEMIERAGGINVMNDAFSGFPQLNPEAVTARAPDVIVDLAMGSEGSAERRAQAIEYWKAFSSVPAIKNNRLYFLNPDLILRPGPRLGQGLDQLRAAFYPPSL